jgi:hypothetical protein
LALHPNNSTASRLLLLRLNSLRQNETDTFVRNDVVGDGGDDDGTINEDGVV